MYYASDLSENATTATTTKTMEINSLDYCITSKSVKKKKILNKHLPISIEKCSKKSLSVQVK